MARNLISTQELTGMRVVGGKNGTHRIGKVRRFVFHPNGKRLIGIVVKRPDVLLMFRRKDQFVSIDGFEIEDGRVVVSPEANATDKAAIKALGVDWDACVLWIGLPVMAQDGTSFGLVGNVVFNQSTGTIHSIETDAGATANTLLGKRSIPAEYIKGFKRGMGSALSQTAAEGEGDGQSDLGAILVSDEVKELDVEGGLAEQAGKATAVAVDKVQTTVTDKVKPVASEAAKKTGEVVNKGAYVTGQQISKSKTMFSDFKEEYQKARGPKPAKKSEEQAVQKAEEVNESAESTAQKPAAAQKTTKSTTKKSTTKTAAKKATTQKKAAPKKNMFAAFKEEYDKARHEE